MPHVSIVVPSYNHAAYLPRRLQSIVAQTYADREIILLDDASDDGSGEICRQFAASQRCRLVLGETNSGSPFRQWNKGIGLAAGELIWIAESDDDADPRFLETLVTRLDAHPEQALAYCRSRRVDSAGKPLSLTATTLGDVDPERWAQDFSGAGAAEIGLCLGRENTIPNASAVVFRRSAYQRAGGVDENLRLCADWKFWIAILHDSSFAYVAEALNDFRVHAQTVRASTSIWIEVAENLEVMRYARTIVPLDPDQARQLATRVAKLILFALSRRIPSVRELARVRDQLRQLQLGWSSANLRLLCRDIASVRRRRRTRPA